MIIFAFMTAVVFTALYYESRRFGFLAAAVGCWAFFVGIFIGAVI